MLRPSIRLPRSLWRASASVRVEIYIALRYSYFVAKEITTAEYQALAELRYRLRRFVGEGDAAARAAGLELIDRLETHGYVRRSRSRNDRRRVLVALLPRGEKLLEQVARDRIGELRASGAALVNAISALLEVGGSPTAKKKPR
jgi:DNA-binding MarR family transcriptional regulator